VNGTSVIFPAWLFTTQLVGRCALARLEQCAAGSADITALQLVPASEHTRIFRGAGGTFSCLLVRH
jgi:hypothetical protein